MPYELYSKYDNYIISREYNPSGIKSRIDLAIIENNQIKDTEQIVKIYDDKKIKNGTVVNININIDASVDQLDELSEKIKQLLNSINE